MDIDVTSKQNGLPLNRGDWTASGRSNSNPDSHNFAPTASPPAANGSDAAHGMPKSYESPVVKIDPSTGAAVLSFLNPGSDEQAFQVPSRTALQYEQQQRLAVGAVHTVTPKDTQEG